MKRIMALDVGSVRIGIAVSDPLGITAQGIAVIAFKKWKSELDVWVRKYSPGAFVIGLPLRTSGIEGPEAGRVRDFGEELKMIYGDIEILFMDERYSSKIANRVMAEASLSSRARRGRVDSVAAAVFLQDFLDNNRRTDST